MLKPWRLWPGGAGAAAWRFALRCARHRESPGTFLPGRLGPGRGRHPDLSKPFRNDSRRAGTAAPRPAASISRLPRLQPESAGGTRGLRIDRRSADQQTARGSVPFSPGEIRPLGVASLRTAEPARPGAGAAAAVPSPRRHLVLLPDGGVSLRLSPVHAAVSPLQQTAYVMGGAFAFPGAGRPA
jgi:hypothetical protein